jgi:hypothetical protein
VPQTRCYSIKDLNDRSLLFTAADWTANSDGGLMPFDYHPIAWGSNSAR